MRSVQAYSAPNAFEIFKTAILESAHAKVKLAALEKLKLFYSHQFELDEWAGYRRDKREGRHHDNSGLLRSSEN